MSDPVEALRRALEGRYLVERELGEGGMATVYLGSRAEAAIPSPCPTAWIGWPPKVLVAPWWRVI